MFINILDTKILAKVCVNKFRQGPVIASQLFEQLDERIRVTWSPEESTIVGLQNLPVRQLGFCEAHDMTAQLLEY